MSNEEKEIKLELIEIKEGRGHKTFIYKDLDKKEAQSLVDRLLRKKVI
jgi:hypothetical protein